MDDTTDVRIRLSGSSLSEEDLYEITAELIALLEDVDQVAASRAAAGFAPDGAKAGIAGEIVSNSDVILQFGSAAFGSVLLPTVKLIRDWFSDKKAAGIETEFEFTWTDKDGTRRISGSGPADEFDPKAVIKAAFPQARVNGG